ncbi:hypothetical protein ADUPG1_004249, partial [Aduncisulcus paluster]
DSPILMGKPAMKDLGITLNVRSVKLGGDLRHRMRCILYRMYGILDKSIKDIDTKTKDMRQYVDAFKRAKNEVKPLDKLREAVEGDDPFAVKEWDTRIARETRF